MKFSLAVFALGVAPAFGYLASLEKAATAAKVESGEAPYYFTNGASDSPLGSASSGIKSYLDGLVSSPATQPRGAGMTSYLDALPHNPVATTGSGMTSYAESLNKAGAAAAPVEAAAPAAPAAAAPTSFAADGTAAATSAGYMAALSSGTTSISGAGIKGYLDALPTAPSMTGGAGISNYLSSLPASNVASGGAGLRTYQDALSPSSGYSKPPAFGLSGKSAPKSFTIGSVSGSFDFSFEADSAILEKIAAAGGRKIVLSGTVESVSYN
jgi:hypothetical protein